MKKMTGIVLMVIGGLAFIIGAIIYFNSDKKAEIDTSEDNIENYIEMAIADGVLTTNERNIIKQKAEEKGRNYDELMLDVEKRISELGFESETELIDYNKKNGNDFEKFVVQKFNKKYFTIKEWAGDKYVDGKYAKTTPQPDIRFEFSLKEDKCEFSVECKWRKNLYNDGVLIAKDYQLKQYKEFERNNNIPVFIAIGLGSSGAYPERLFILPLKDINNSFIHIDVLSKYEKDMKENFFFDYEKGELK
jgi:hypothetical protein